MCDRPRIHVLLRLLSPLAALVVAFSATTASTQVEAAEGPPAKVFRAGAYAMDVTPDWFPIVVNGGFQPRYAKEAVDPLHARCLVLDDGAGQVAIVLVDSCVIDRPLFDEAKRLAHEASGIPVERMFMAATHTHSAPAVVGALNTPPDERYCKFLPRRIAEGIRRAQANLVPAKVGWGIGKLPELAKSRRWIARPDKIKIDPFGEPTTRATMHPGFRNPEWEEESGPMDPHVSVLAVKRQDGRPLALLAAFSIHYVGAPVLSADYFGAFANRIGELIGPQGVDPAFVGILANGTSGDAYIRDYGRESARKFDRFSVADAVARVALKEYRSMQFHDWVPLVTREEKLELAVRKPKLDWAKKVLAEAEGGELKTMSQVYAGEQVLLSKMPPTRELKLQTLRIGGLGIVGIPCEVFAITGLKIRYRSPLEPTFVISLANGWDGYLPPPEQMAMGGYTTWLARSSCLEAEAEPKIVAKVMEMLEGIAGDAKVARVAPIPAPYAAAVLASKPTVYWRLEEMNGPEAIDAISGRAPGTFETQVAYFMPGPRPEPFPGFYAENSAPHFVGQRMKAELADPGTTYSVELWCYNAMPVDARPVTGYLFARGPGTGDETPSGDCLGIGGTETGAGKLFFHTGDDAKEALVGKTEIGLRSWDRPKSWHHVVLVRDGDRVTVYLNGNTVPEISARGAPPCPAGAARILLGGRADNTANFEGKIDEVAIYRRALPPEEIARHYRAATGTAR